MFNVYVYIAKLTNTSEDYVFNINMKFQILAQASTLYANNLSKLLLSMAGTKDHYHLDFADDVVRGSIVLNKGEMAWPPNPPISGKIDIL